MRPGRAWVGEIRWIFPEISRGLRWRFFLVTTVASLLFPLKPFCKVPKGGAAQQTRSYTHWLDKETRRLADTKAWATHTLHQAHTRRAGVGRSVRFLFIIIIYLLVAGRGNELRTPLLVRKPVWVDSCCGREKKREVNSYCVVSASSIGGLG